MQSTSRRKLFAALPLGAVTLAAARTGTAAQTTNSTTSIVSFPVGSGTLSNGTAFAGGNFVGTLTVTNFQVINGVLTAVGSLAGSLLNATGGVVATTTQIINLATTVSGSCQILTLTLGPLDLNLLGLMVHLNQVVLTITAVSGSGNLLGNLLCAVANLLNGGGALQTLLNNLATLLNQILKML